MAQTFDIPVTVGVWTDVSNGLKKGFITNFSQHQIRYKYAETQPLISDTFGHIINPQEKRYFDLVGSKNKVWAFGLYSDARIALTEKYDAALLTSSKVEFAKGPNMDPSGRLRVSEPFGILENKNILSRNRGQWEEILSGVILEYTTLVGGPFTPGEEIRGTGVLLPIATINTDSGTALNVDCVHNDFTVGMTITGQTSGATAVLTSTDTGSDIQHDYNSAGVNLTVGTGATDYAIRQTHRRAAYVPFRSQYPSLTFRMAPVKTNVVQRVGFFDNDDGVFLERTDSDVAFVIRSSTSGSPVDTRYLQSEWNIDRLDGGASGGPNPSGAILDLDKVQLVALPFVWQGVASVIFAFEIDNELIYVHEVVTANIATLPYMREPSLPLRYEIRNTGVTASPTTMLEICSTVSSEGGYILPGLQFSASSGITPRTVSSAGLVPVFAIRLKNSFNGKKNTRVAKFISAAGAVATNDAYIEIRHIYQPIDITATWNSAGEGSGVEYSTNISAVTGRPSHKIEAFHATTAAANKASASDIREEFINHHVFISQNFNSTNSEMFVIYAQAYTGNSDIRPSITWIEFD